MNYEQTDVGYGGTGEGGLVKNEGNIKSGKKHRRERGKIEFLKVRELMLVSRVNVGVGS